MSRGPNFIEREVFEDVMSRLDRDRGGPYSEVSMETAYGDMSRLVVALLATASQEELQRIYTAGGWQAAVSFSASRKAAKAFMKAYHPGRVSEPE